MAGKWKRQGRRAGGEASIIQGRNYGTFQRAFDKSAKDGYCRVEMKKRILDYIQLSLQGTGIAALGTLSIFEPKFETVIFGGMCILGGLLIAIKNKGA